MRCTAVHRWPGREGGCARARSPAEADDAAVVRGEGLHEPLLTGRLHRARQDLAPAQDGEHPEVIEATHSQDQAVLRRAERHGADAACDEELMDELPVARLRLPPDDDVTVGGRGGEHRGVATVCPRQRLHGRLVASQLAQDFVSLHAPDSHDLVLRSRRQSPAQGVVLHVVERSVPGGVIGHGCCPKRHPRNIAGINGRRP
mmetsp:Transcript_12772/g.35037  ORF Transcript_12772/g.35037 Transcript_12772/m.35037 type:complete len:202 (+) Transcript_12772:449-1054(+)